MMTWVGEKGTGKRYNYCIFEPEIGVSKPSRAVVGVINQVGATGILKFILTL